MRGNAYTIGFTLVICVLLSILLSSTAMILKPKQEFNQKLDKQKNILIAAGVDIKNIKSGEELANLFSKKVVPMVITASGQVLKDKLPDDIDAKENKNQYPLYAIKSKSSEISSYVYPVVGKGLWSSLYGYLAVGPKGREIIGITFYKQGETPGLGAEIEKEWFRDDFKGKQLYKGNTLVGVEVVKGQAKDKVNYKSNKEYMVNGISGATITGNGITKMLKTDPLKYQNFFLTLNKARG